MSIDSVMGRIAAIQAMTAPPVAPPPGPAAAAPSTTSPTSFASTLQGAMAGAPAGGAAPVQAAPGTYPHLSGDLDANPELLQRLEALAAQRGEHFTITSGGGRGVREEGGGGAA